ncbi:MAG TPA: TldD/PmbA family protein [Myxococcota bacterium]|nr:TldD/PmbA family protein [Myxococcota bacterium]HOC99972.1 TldD/PmbA family protein [Myxococcota bacterium]
MVSKSIFPAVMLLVLVAMPARSSEQQADPVMEAMLQELDRSVNLLRLEAGDYDLPYFVYYAVRDVRSSFVSARNGALQSSNDGRTRMADVDIRVGSYDMDSSEDKDAGFNFNQKYNPGFMGPIDDSIPALRRTLWLLSDHAYKAALMSFHNVKAKLVNSSEPRKSASLSREQPVELIEEISEAEFDRPAREGHARELSAIFLQYPDIFDSGVEISAFRVVRYIVNSEGTRIRTVDHYYQLLAQATVRAPDGMLLQDGVTIYGRRPGDMPDLATAADRIRTLARNLVAMKDAPVLDPATVPVLMSPEATGVFFHETIGHRLEGQRQEDEEEGRTFKSYLNQAILPAFLDIFDDPSVEMFGTGSGRVSLNGFYRVDDEGVRGQKVSLVEKGVLKAFLMSRKPIEGFEKSNGHGRTQGFRPAQARMANLFIQGARPMSQARLFSRFLQEMKKQNKPWGLYVETIAGGNTNTSSYGYQAFKGKPLIAYKVDAATGKKTMVRGVEIVGTPLSAINRIIATSDRYGVFNGYCGAESGSVPVSTVAPEVLFSEMELQRTEDTNERPLILPPPDVPAAAR